MLLLRLLTVVEPLWLTAHGFPRAVPQHTGLHRDYLHLARRNLLREQLEIQGCRRLRQRVWRAFVYGLVLGTMDDGTSNVHNKLGCQPDATKDVLLDGTF